MGISRPSHSVFVFPAFSGRISLAAQGFRLNLLMLFFVADDSFTLICSSPLMKQQTEENAYIQFSAQLPRNPLK